MMVTASVRPSPLGLLRPFPVRRVARRPYLTCHATQNFGDELQKKAREAQRKLEQWANEQKIQEKARRTFEQAQATVESAASQIDREYEVKKKASAARPGGGHCRTDPTFGCPDVRELAQTKLFRCRHKKQQRR